MASVKMRTVEAGGGELDGVGEKVGEDLQDAVGVAVEEESLGGGSLGRGEGGEFEVDGVGVGHAGHGLDGLLGQVAEGATANLERGAAGLHALEVEDVVDEADEAVGVGDGDAEEVLGLGVYVADDAGGEQTERSADAGERSAELVRDGGDELVFERVELGALGELNLVLVLLFPGVGQLRGEFADGALRADEGE